MYRPDEVPCLRFGFRWDLRLETAGIDKYEGKTEKKSENNTPWGREAI